MNLSSALARGAQRQRSRYWREALQPHRAPQQEPARQRTSTARGTLIGRGAAALGLAVALSLVTGSATAARAQQLPLPSAGLPGYLQGAQEVPDPGLIYRVVFDIDTAGPAGKVHPALQTVARYVNSLAEYGVPPIRRQFVVLLHGAATDLALNAASYAAHNHGRHNPDAAILVQLQSTGVSVRVDTQSLLSEHLGARDLLPGLRLDLWAVSTLVNLQLHGYVRVGS